MKRWILLILLACLMPAALAESDVQLTSSEELNAYIAECADQLQTEIHFSYTKALDDLFSDDARFNELLLCSGIGSCTYETTKSRELSLHISQYRTGFRVARLAEMGEDAVLTSNDEALLARANGIIANIRKKTDDPLLTEFMLVDYICKNVKYRPKTLSAENALPAEETALGALYYGAGDSGAYADAFYLLGSLAGLDVCYQHGIDAVTGEPYLWNGICLNDRWFMVDVLRDDPDHPSFSDLHTYAHCNFGVDFAGDHRWSTEVAAHAYAMTSTKYYYYTIKEPELGRYFKTLNDAAAYAVYQGQNKYTDVHVMTNGSYGWEDLSKLIEAKLKTPASWQISAQTIGNRTMFAVKWY